MKYSDWLESLHPSTKAIFHTLVSAHFKKPPNFIVFCMDHPVSSVEGDSMMQWLAGHCDDHWGKVGPRNEERYNIIGFASERDAAIFKLAHGR
jgi:hypothetical protein